MTDRTAREAELREVAGILMNARIITAVCHENADADTLGAALAIKLIADRLGKTVEVVSLDGVPAILRFLPGAADVRPRSTLHPDLVVVCDAATLERVGAITLETADWEGSQILNIDHHATNQYFGTANYVDPSAAATCQLLAELLPYLEIEPDPDLATLLLVGILRDSQGFADTRTSARTLRTASVLVDAGADLPSLHRRILLDMTYPTLALWGRILAGVGERQNGRIVYATLPESMLEATGTEHADADGIAEFMARASGADMTLLLREIDPTKTRVSLRTTDRVNATTIAGVFGGGGHAHRAGCTIEAALDEALGLLLPQCEAALIA